MKIREDHVLSLAAQTNKDQQSKTADAANANKLVTPKIVVLKL